MTPDMKVAVVQIMTAICQDNLGQKMTVALANGLLLQLDQELNVLIQQSEANDKNDNI